MNRFRADGGDPSRTALVDLQVAQLAIGPERGMARYSTEWTRAMSQSVHSILVNPSLPFPRTFPQDLLASHRVEWNTWRAFRRALDHGDRLVYQITAPFLFHAPAWSEIPPWVSDASVPVASIVYDMIPFLFDHSYLTEPENRSRHTVRLERLRHCDLLLALSDCTRQDLVRYAGVDPDRVVTIGAGASASFRPPGPSADPHQRIAAHVPAIERPFVLSVAGFERRKNVETLLDAWARLPASLRREHQLVVTCDLPGAARASWLAQAAERGLHPGEVVLTGLVDEQVLLGLYQAARLFVFPSRYEGFGLPALEAACCGVPVLTSNVSSLPEILDDDRAMFDPGSSEECAARISQALEDRGYEDLLGGIARRAAARHTWDAVAARTSAAYDRLPERRQRPRVRRPRIAIVGPFPPLRSGVAGYNARVVERLAGLADLDCFGEPGSRWCADARRPFRMFPSRALGRAVHPGAYDLVLYTLGNSIYHVETYHLARRYPGVLWLHDVNLAGLVVSLAQLQHPGPRELANRRDFLAAQIARYGERGSGVLLDDDTFEEEVVARGAGVMFTSDLARESLGVIVGSHGALRMLDLDLGPYEALPPVAVLPHAHRDVGPDPRSQARDDRRPWIVVPGLVYPERCPNAIIAAFAIVLRQQPEARLAFVGEVLAHLMPDYLDTAREHGVLGAVEFAGYVESDAYLDWLGRASCVVALRRRSQGESSGAVADALTMGRAVVTNVASASELPAAAAHVVPIDAQPEAIAEAILKVLTSPRDRERYERAARSHADAWTFDHLADALVEVSRRVAARGEQALA